jgi:23S rRNA (adenine2503-C2)-methyltransferase
LHSLIGKHATVIIAVFLMLLCRLLKLLERVEAKVNLIMFNPYSGTKFQSSQIDQVLAFRSVLVGGGRVCTIRDSRGDDEMAACGQLGDPELSSRAGVMLTPPEKFREAMVN